MGQKKVQIEKLLETMGSAETPEDHKHRYQLRRTLLCSKFFECSHKKNRWNTVFTYTAPLMAGTVVVGAFAFLAVSLPSTETLVVETSTPRIDVVVNDETIRQASAFSVEQPIPASAFVSNPEEPLVQLADFVEGGKIEAVRFTPITSQVEEFVR